mgnify:CR=1 FL=1
MVKKLLVRKIEEEGLADEIVRVCVPTEKVKRVRGNTHRVTERKLYPGYVFIEMCMAENGTCPERSWFMFKETTGVGDFIGSEGRPSEMSPAEVSKMLGQVEEAEASPAIQMEFQKQNPENGKRKSGKRKTENKQNLENGKQKPGKRKTEIKGIL